MNLIIFGTNERALRVMTSILEEGYKIDLLVTKASCSSLIAAAKSHGVECFAPTDINSDESIERLKAVKPDLMLMVSFNQILRKRVIEIPRIGVFNCHGGKLPEYRGSSVLNWQIINNEPKIGVSIIKVDGGIDTGDIVFEEEFKLGPDDDINYVLAKSFEKFQEMTLKLLKAAKSKKLKYKKQKDSKAGYWCNRTAEDGRIDWKTQSGLEIHNLVRSLTLPYPCAYTYLDGKRVNIVKTKMSDIPVHAVPGRVSRVLSGGVVVGSSGYSSVIVTEIQLDNGKVVDAKDYFKTFPTFFDDCKR